MACGYGPFNYGNCECGLGPGLMDFYLPVPETPRYKFCRFANMGTKQLPNRGHDGSLGDQWSIDYRDKTRRSAGLTVSDSNLVLRTETIVDNPFSDPLGNAGGVADERDPLQDPFDEGWTMVEGTWVMGATTIELELDEPYGGPPRQRGQLVTEYHSPDVTITAFGLQCGTGGVEAGLLGRYEAWDSSWRLELDEPAGVVRLVNNDTTVASEPIPEDIYHFAQFELKLSGQYVTASVVLEDDDTVIAVFNFEGTDTDYNYQNTPSKAGLFGFVDDEDGVVFVSPDAAAFQIHVVSTARQTLYDVAAQKVCVSVPPHSDYSNSGLYVVSPNILCGPLVFFRTDVFADDPHVVLLGSSSSLPDMSDEGFVAGYVRTLLESGGVEDRIGFRYQDWEVVGNADYGWRAVTPQRLGHEWTIIRLAAPIVGTGGAIGRGFPLAIGYRFDIDNMDSVVDGSFETHSGTITNILAVGTIDFDSTLVEGQPPTFTPVTEIDRWESPNGPFFNNISVNPPLTDDHVRALCTPYFYIPVNPLNDLNHVPSFQATSDGSAWAVTWRRAGTTSTVQKQKVCGGGVIDTIPDITYGTGGDVTSANALLLQAIAVVGPGVAAYTRIDSQTSTTADKYFRILPSEYENTNDAHWDSAVVRQAGTNWIFVTSVGDIDDLITFTPEDYPSTSGALYISHDGETRLPVVVWDEGDDRYENPGTMISDAEMVKAQIPYISDTDIDFS